MSTSTSRPQRSGHPAFAAYMASVFSSAARLCAHETGFVAARVRVLRALGTATQDEASGVGRLVHRVRSHEVAAENAWQRARDAVERCSPYKAVASHTSVALTHRVKAQELEDQARTLEAVVGARFSPRSQPGETAGAPIVVWSVPAHRRPYVALESSTATDRTLRTWLVRWARDAQPGDQLLLYASQGHRRLVQVARPRSDTETWPWTVQVSAGLVGQRQRENRDALLALRDFLGERRFVTHGGPQLWCHVAPGQPARFAGWLVEVLEAVVVAE